MCRPLETHIREMAEQNLSVKKAVARHDQDRVCPPDDISTLKSLIDSIAMDWNDRCDHPEDCSCSMAQAVRIAAAGRNMTVSEFISN